jgi:hypothetical protein
MRFQSGRQSHRRHSFEPRPEEPDAAELSNPESTGSEASYMRFLIDSRTVVTVVLTTGERFRGRIRYYDRDLLSLGPIGGGANLLLRKSGLHSVIED